MVAQIRTRFQMQGTDAEVQNRNGHVWTFRDGVALSLWNYPNPRDALEKPSGLRSSGTPMTARRPAIPSASERRVAIKTRDAGRIEIAFAELGEGEPVLLLHGFPQHAGCWHTVAPVVAESYRVICPDLRGFGLSDAPGRGYGIDTFTTDLGDVLDALGIDRVRLAAHDWGGYVAFKFCLDSPDRVSSYLALNTFSPWVRPSPRFLIGMWRSWYAIGFAAVGRRILQRDPGPIPRGVVRDAVHPAISPADAAGYGAHLRAPERALAGQLLYRDFLRRALAAARGGGEFAGRRLTVPTHFLFGERDGWVPRLGTGGFMANTDDGTLEFVPDSGHFIQEEKPELVARRALELFGRFD